MFNIYELEEVGNGVMLTIHEEQKTVTIDNDEKSAIERLITHLANKLDIPKEEK